MCQKLLPKEGKEVIRTRQKRAPAGNTYSAARPAPQRGKKSKRSNTEKEKEAVMRAGRKGREGSLRTAEKGRGPPKKGTRFGTLAPGEKMKKKRVSVPK